MWLKFKDFCFSETISVDKNCEISVYAKAGMKILSNILSKKDKITSLIETDSLKLQNIGSSSLEYKTLICQGEKLYISTGILNEIPYLETLFSGRFGTNQTENGKIETKEIDPILLKVIIRYLEEKKKYILLGCLEKEKDLMDLLELFRFLALKPPIDVQFPALCKRLTQVPSLVISSQNDLVDYALTLFYVAGLVNWKKERNFRNMIYNTIMYVFKNNEHSSSFKPRSKFHLKKLSLKCVTFSYNQFVNIQSLECAENLDDSDNESILSDDSSKYPYISELDD